MSVYAYLVTQMRCLVMQTLLLLVCVANAQNQEKGIALPPIDAEHRAVVYSALGDGVLTEEELTDLRRRGVDEKTLAELRDLFRQVRGRVRQPGTAYLDIQLREIISKREIEYIGLLLKLSEAQQIHLGNEFNKYKDNAERIWADRTTSVWQKSADVAAMSLGDTTQALLHKELADEVVRIDAELERGDVEFLNSLAVALSDEQAERLPRAIDLRRRTAWTADPTWHPGSDIDLEVLLFDLWNASAAAPPEMGDPIDTALQNYEQALTPLVVQLRRMIDGAAAGRSRIIAQIKSLRAEEHTALGDVEAEQRRVNEPLIRIAKQIHDLNVATIPQLAMHLDADVAESLKETFKTQAYKPVFPFDSHTTRIIDELLADQGISAEQSQFLADLRSQLVASMDQIHDRMIARYLEWRREVAALSGFRKPDYLQYREDMLQFERERCDATVRTLHLLQPVFPDKTKAIDAARKLIQRRLEARSNPLGGSNRLGWPDPYDNFE